MRTHRGSRVAPSTFVVEGYWPAGTADSFGEATARLEARIEQLRNDGVAMRTVAATLVPSDEAAYWVVDGPSAEVVSLACAGAGIRVERIVGALELRAGKAVGPGRQQRGGRGDLPASDPVTARGGRREGWRVEP